jgi:hypothetical protein
MIAVVGASIDVRCIGLHAILPVQHSAPQAGSYTTNKPGDYSQPVPNGEEEYDQPVELEDEQP